MGVGNILLTDEGFGVRAVEYLQANYTWPENVRLEDGGTQGLLLMSTLMDCDTLVVLDVVLGPEKPGTIYMLEGEDLRKSLEATKAAMQDMQASLRESIDEVDAVARSATASSEVKVEAKDDAPPSPDAHDERRDG